MGADGEGEGAFTRRGGRARGRLPADLECGEVSPLWIPFWFFSVAAPKKWESGDTSPHSKSRSLDAEDLADVLPGGLAGLVVAVDLFAVVGGPIGAQGAGLAAQ